MRQFLTIGFLIIFITPLPAFAALSNSHNRQINLVILSNSLNKPHIFNGLYTGIDVVQTCNGTQSITKFRGDQLNTTRIDLNLMGCTTQREGRIMILTWVNGMRAASNERREDQCNTHQMQNEVVVSMNRWPNTRAQFNWLGCR